MHKTDVLFNKKWGVFTHYLDNAQNNPENPVNMKAGRTSWNECVECFDVELFAEQLSLVNAGYLVFTVMQGSQYLCSPNATFNKISGYKPGEACSKRDLILDLCKALKKYNIDLYLYYTGDGPWCDPVAGPKFGFVNPRKNVSRDFVQKWADVAREYSLRYGDMIKGWWVDGCYKTEFGYDDHLLKIYLDAFRAGNPNTLTAFNNGVMERVMAYTDTEDFTAGEMNDFFDIPDARFTGCEQWHTLAPLGISPDENEWNSWCKPGIKHSGEYMKNYIQKVNEHGGVVTIDICLYRDGSIDREHLEVLSHLKALRFK